MSTVLHKMIALTRSAFIAVIVLSCFTNLSAQHNDHNAKQGDESWQGEVEQQEFKAGEMIIEHITDAYEWHIITIGHTHVTVPLPIMLYDEGKFHFFMSSVFHHHDNYEGYFISHHEMNAGKIVRKDAAGEEVRPVLDFSFTKMYWPSLSACSFLSLSFYQLQKHIKGEKEWLLKGFNHFLSLSLFSFAMT